MPVVGKAAARVTREHELRSAAMPGIGEAAARGTGEGGPEVAAKHIV
jgi:hypothetical protein